MLDKLMHVAVGASLLGLVNIAIVLIDTAYLYMVNLLATIVSLACVGCYILYVTLLGFIDAKKLVRMAKGRFGSFEAARTEAEKLYEVLESLGGEATIDQLVKKTGYQEEDLLMLLVILRSMKYIDVSLETREKIKAKL